MASRTPKTLATASDGSWAADTEARSRLASSPTRSQGPKSSGSFSYQGTHTPKLPLLPVSDEGLRSSHRTRFLTDEEKILATDPAKTRQSHRALESVTTQPSWFDQPIESVLQQLGVADSKAGLSDEDAAHRLAQYGPNALEGSKRAPVWVIFVMQFFNLIIGLLMFAALASIALLEYVEGVAIIAIVTLNAVIATMQESRAGSALEALAKMSSPQCVVVRGGKQAQIASDALVPGDVVVLTTGDIVPADIRLTSTSDCKVNEMILTGESEDVHKKFDADMARNTKLTADNMVFASTSIACGNATGVVVETAMNTRVGSIAALLKDKSAAEGGSCVARFLTKYQTKMTPLQEALHRLGVFMGSAVLVVCAVVFTVGMVRGNHDPKNAERPVWLTMVMVAVSLAVSAVPEGLPMVVTICLSTGTSDMVKKGVLVRKLTAVESLGAASVICTDKTGTLTEGKMTAIKAWGDFYEYAITGTGFDPNGDVLLNNVKQTAANNPQVHAMLLSAVLCSNTTLQQDQTDDGYAVWYPMGNASEAPLVVAAAKMGIWEADVGDKYPRVSEIPFNSSRKMMITLNEVAANAAFGRLALPRGTTHVANVKGAPNFIVPNCHQFVRKSGEVVDMSAKDRDAILDAVDELSSQALRVLAIAINPLAGIPFAADEDDIDAKFAQLCKPLVFVGLVASIDPPRAGVKESIKTARAASIRTVMITGDYLKTAIAIAKTIDLLSVGADVDEEAVDCSTLRPRGDEYLTDHDIDEITSRTSVFARAKPEDKIEIVKSLQRQGHKGRGIYTNIQKFVCFLLSTNFGEISIIFVAIATGMPNPLEPLQILVLNLFADGMAAVALSLEKGDPRAMLERPRPKTQPIIHGRLWVLVLTNAFLIGAGALVVFSAGLYWNFRHVFMDDILGGAKSVDEYRSVRCYRWQGVRAHWKVFGNCDALSNDGSRLFPVLPLGGSGYEDRDMYCETGTYECLTDGIARAQTMAFVYITTMEMFRAYTARSFTNHVFVGFCSNPYMQFAAVGSVALTLFVTNTPVVRDDLFGFASIYWFQWLFAMVVAFAFASIGEMLKCVYRRSDRERARWANVDDGFGTVLLEIRNLRHHVEKLEDKLEVANHKPARRLTFLHSTSNGAVSGYAGVPSRESSRATLVVVPTPLQENMV
ncbi:hypothetical protein PybrP1_004261 [[Pythium] brassicae (nom. inval.)]|nr:hypothetical protein PybrP1_004261 [[Pythium] brassicae (nom. inval.)]